jgi:peroxiredoxin
MRVSAAIFAIPFLWQCAPALEPTALPEALAETTTGHLMDAAVPPTPMNGSVHGSIAASGPTADAGVADAEAPVAKEEAGKKAPAIGLASLNGAGKAELKKGKVAIVFFWATWCEPCKREIPEMQALFNKYAAKGLLVVGISVDEDSKGIAKFAKKFGAKFPIVWDKKKTAAKQWNPEAMPMTYVVDGLGTIRHEHRGYRQGDETSLEAEVKALF